METGLAVGVGITAIVIALASGGAVVFAAFLLILDSDNPLSAMAGTLAGVTLFVLAVASLSEYIPVGPKLLLAVIGISLAVAFTRLRRE